MVTAMVMLTADAHAEAAVDDYNLILQNAREGGGLPPVGSNYDGTLEAVMSAMTERFSIRLTSASALLPSSHLVPVDPEARSRWRPR